MNPVALHPEALLELQEQALYYESQVPGLGERFVSQIESAVRLAASMPTIGSPYGHGTRRVFPQDFPFSVVYRVMGSGLVVLAIAPFKRKPGYWRSRS